MTDPFLTACSSPEHCPVELEPRGIARPRPCRFKWKTRCILRRMTATPEALLDAWIYARARAQWLFAIDPQAVPTLAVDARVGGEFSILETIRGSRIYHFGQYLEIVRPRRLCFTLESPSTCRALRW
jgi:hypothetical protein